MIKAAYGDTAHGPAMDDFIDRKHALQWSLYLFCSTEEMPSQKNKAK